MRRAALCAMAMLAACTALPVRAQPTDELESLKQEQARLRQSLDAIDRRIRALEDARGTPSAPLPAGNRPASESTPSLVALQRNWGEIKPGIAKARVDELLGKPDREMHINGDLVWYYVYPAIGRGSVFFSEKEKVTAIQAPISGWTR
ncbi:MAG TPA: hypothetical protein VEU32_20180 [Burkholderiales bacterium]|nr:hypothetical protein [Burkholderiales bacterium]